jgi:hypothetical protein
MDDTSTPFRAMTKTEICKTLGITGKTLAGWLALPDAPKPIRTPGHERFLFGDVLKFLRGEEVARA